MRDFILTYDGREADLPRMRIQYNDYALWQNSEKTVAAKQGQKEYWLRVFQEDVPALNLPRDFQRPDVETYRGEMLTRHLEAELSRRVERLAEETGTTLFMVLLAAYYVLLFKYTGREDIVVGTPVTGRRHMDLSDIVGMFVNMLAPRNRPSPAKTFETFLAEVKESVISALENRDFHFEELVAALGKRDGSGRNGGNPLFDVVFAMQNVDIEQEAGVPTGDLYRLNAVPHVFQHEVSQFDLILGAFRGEETITLDLRYATTLFKRSTAEKILNRCAEILEQAVEDRGVLLEDIIVSHELLSAGAGVVEEEDNEFQF